MESHQRARARGARRSNAISLGASYSRYLSAGTRVSRRFHGGANEEKVHSERTVDKSRRTFHIAGERFAGKLQPFDAVKRSKMSLEEKNRKEDQRNLFFLSHQLLRKISSFYMLKARGIQDKICIYNLTDI